MTVENASRSIRDVVASLFDVPVENASQLIGRVSELSRLEVEEAYRPFFEALEPFLISLPS